MKDNDEDDGVIEDITLFPPRLATLIKRLNNSMNAMRQTAHRIEEHRMRGENPPFRLTKRFELAHAKASLAAAEIDEIEEAESRKKRTIN
ncbi:MAG: hypothetical protein RIB41_10170 [Oceanibaculum nanhaiense]|jgi:hypothetical protein|uniref:hypothetical protein n=1 Tax=Oceanibaculum nanhaiense TaxID=1909734 RepID=UPI0032EE41B8